MSKNGRDDEAEPTGAKSDKDKDDSGKINGLQIAAATGAATTAAMVANALGIYGTVTGVAVFSVVSSVGTVVYLKSMRHTKAKFDKVVKYRDTVVMRARDGGDAATVVTLSAAEPPPAEATRPLNIDPDATRPLDAAATVPIDPKATATGTAKVPVAAVADDDEPESASALARSVEFLKRNWRPIAVSSFIVFVLTVGLLTSIAMLSGKPATSFYDANPGPTATTPPDSPDEDGDGGRTSQDTPSDDGTPSDRPSDSEEPDQPSSPESTTKQPSPSTSEPDPGGEGEGDGDLKPTPSAEDNDASRQ